MTDNISSSSQAAICQRTPGVRLADVRSLNP
jgi:hypothetical protein